MTAEPHAGLGSRARAEEVLASLDERGYAIVEGLLEPEAVARARAELSAILERTPFGRDDFEGRRTRRVYALFAKTRTFDGAATHPLVLRVLDQVLGHYQLSAPAGIEIGPGAAAQPLHPDDAIFPLPRPHDEVVGNVMWPLDEFTAENGATRIVPGSHRWGDEHPDADAATITATMPAGSALLYRGSLWHGAGETGPTTRDSASYSTTRRRGYDRSRTTCCRYRQTSLEAYPNGSRSSLVTTCTRPLSATSTVAIPDGSSRPDSRHFPRAASMSSTARIDHAHQEFSS